ncbi:MAG: Ger(x)C family spore germination protein [Caldicoprobacterales bacterium]|jgi:Ger(x)C family germination protein
MKKAIPPILLLIMIIDLLTLTGCWDRKDIENRGYVLGIAVDSYSPKDTKAKGHEAKKEEFEETETAIGQPIYEMTVQIPIIKRSPSLAALGAGGSSGGNEPKTWQISQVGNAFISMEREMESRTSLTLYYEHLQVLVLSDKVLKDGLHNMVDFFLRHREMRTSVSLFVAEGSAKKILEVVPQEEDHAATYLFELPINADKNSRIAYKHNLGEAMNCLRSGDAFILPRVEASKDEIKITGGALIKDGKMAGWADELDIEVINVMADKYQGGTVIGRLPGSDEGIIIMEVTSSKTKVTPVIKDGELSFDVHVKMKGKYAEQVGVTSGGLVDIEYIKECEKEFAKTIETRCKKTIEKMQKECNVDVFQLNRKVRTQKPAYWEEVKDEWDEIFPNLDINVKADVTIQMIGVMK